MKRKVTFVGEDWGYWIIEDISDQYLDIVKEDGKEVADSYFAVGEYDDNDENNYVLGIIESISQSDYCPPKLYTEKIEKIVVEEVL